MQRNGGKKIKWERLEISSRKLEIPREYSWNDAHNKVQKGYRPNRSRRHWEEAGRIHRRMYQKGLNDQYNYDGVITYLEPDTLECEVKWTIGSITMNKASAGDGIPVELFQILKHDAVKVLHSIYQKICKIQQWPQD